MLLNALLKGAMKGVLFIRRIAIAAVLFNLSVLVQFLPPLNVLKQIHNELLPLASLHTLYLQKLLYSELSLLPTRSLWKITLDPARLSTAFLRIFCLLL